MYRAADRRSSQDTVRGAPTPATSTGLGRCAAGAATSGHSYTQPSRHARRQARPARPSWNVQRWS
eukprot:2359934-Alexandrium_andersonii.AAC.1